MELKNGFVDLGTRNKPTYFEYGSAHSFKHAKVPASNYDIPVFFGFGQGKPNKHCHHLDVIEATKKLLLTEFEEGKYDETFFEQVIKVYLDKFKKLQEMCKHDFSRDDNQVLAEKFELAMDYIMESHKPMLLALNTLYLDEVYTAKLKEILKSEEKDAINTVKSILLTLPQPSIAQEEEQALYEIEKAFAESGLEKKKEVFYGFCEKSEIKEKLNLLVHNFGWFHMEYMMDPRTMEQYKDQLWKRIEGSTPLAKSPIGALHDVVKEQEEFFNNHPDSGYLKNFTWMMQKFAHILDHTKVITVKGRYTALLLFTEVAKRIGISDRDLLYLVTPEIISMLRKGEKADDKTRDLIKKRITARAVLLDNGKIQVWEGEEAVKVGEELLHKEVISDSEEIKGIVAYPGKIKGRVTVINSIEDKHKFTKGDILVTHDGPAELTIFLKEAGAIVTNQGGIISHVAIVAREIKTPCIVGTVNATKILKDGDIVEVDADRGIVKRIEKNE